MFVHHDKKHISNHCAQTISTSADQQAQTRSAQVHREIVTNNAITQSVCLNGQPASFSTLPFTQRSKFLLRRARFTGCKGLSSTLPILAGKQWPCHTYPFQKVQSNGAGSTPTKTQVFPTMQRLTGSSTKDNGIVSKLSAKAARRVNKLPLALILVGYCILAHYKTQNWRPYSHNLQFGVESVPSTKSKHKSYTPKSCMPPFQQKSSNENRKNPDRERHRIQPA